MTNCLILNKAALYVQLIKPLFVKHHNGELRTAKNWNNVICKLSRRGLVQSSEPIQSPGGTEKADLQQREALLGFSSSSEEVDRQI